MMKINNEVMGQDIENRLNNLIKILNNINELDLDNHNVLTGKFNKCLNRIYKMAKLFNPSLYIEAKLLLGICNDYNSEYGNYPIQKKVLNSIRQTVNIHEKMTKGATDIWEDFARTYLGVSSADDDEQEENLLEPKETIKEAKTEDSDAEEARGMLKEELTGREACIKSKIEIDDVGISNSAEASVLEPVILGDTSKSKYDNSMVKQGEKFYGEIEYEILAVEIQEYAKIKKAISDLSEDGFEGVFMKAKIEVDCSKGLDIIQKRANEMAAANLVFNDKLCDESINLFSAADEIGKITGINILSKECKEKIMLKYAEYKMNN